MGVAWDIVWNPEVLGEVLALSCSFYSKNGKQAGYTGNRYMYIQL